MNFNLGYVYPKPARIIAFVLIAISIGGLFIDNGLYLTILFSILCGYVAFTTSEIEYYKDSHKLAFITKYYSLFSSRELYSLKKYTEIKIIKTRKKRVSGMQGIAIGNTSTDVQYEYDLCLTTKDLKNKILIKAYEKLEDAQKISKNLKSVIEI